MAMENNTSQSTLDLATPSSSKLQECVGVWLGDKDIRAINADIERKLSNIFESFQTVTNLDECIKYINKPRPGKVFFIVSHKIGKNLIPLMVLENISSVEYFFIVCTENEEQKDWESPVSNKIRGGFTSIKALVDDIQDVGSAYDKQSKEKLLSSSTESAATGTTSENQTGNRFRPYAIPPTALIQKNIQKGSMKDLSKDHVWFIQFRLLIEIIIHLRDSEQAKKDMIGICQKYYEKNDCEQRKIKKFEEEAEDHSRAIYWYTAESFIIHLLNAVCSTEDVDHLYDFRLMISNLHKRICELENDEFTVNLKEKTAILYRGKCMAASIFENFRKNVGNLIAMKGFLSTTSNKTVAEFFSGDGFAQTGSVCVMFKLNIIKWEECTSSTAIKSGEGAMQDESEILFTIGSIWKIDRVGETSENNIWCIELSSCEESRTLLEELKKYLKELVGETSDLFALGDFLMKVRQFEKAEKYYKILENDHNLPEQHIDRAKIYNRLGIIRREQRELTLAIDYFKKAIAAAPPGNDIKETANTNSEITETELVQLPKIFLGKRLGSNDVTSKPLVIIEPSRPILENNLGHAAYLRYDYPKAVQYFQTAASIMKASKSYYSNEISRVYSNLGAVAYKREDYVRAKSYFEDAIHTLQEFTLDHPWIDEYKGYLQSAQLNIKKKQRVE